MEAHMSHTHSQKKVKTLLVLAVKSPEWAECEPKSNGVKYWTSVLCTCGWINSPLNQVVVLVNPFTVALKVDLRGWGGAARQRHRFVLHDELVLRLHQEVR